MGHTSIVCPTVVAMVTWVVINLSFSSSHHFSSCLSLLGDCASLLDQLRYGVLVYVRVNVCAFGNVCMGADKATNSSSTSDVSPSFFLKQQINSSLSFQAW